MSYTSKDVMYNKNLKDILNDIIGQVNNQGGMAIVGSPALAIGSSSKAKVLNGAFTVVRDGVVSTIAGGETAFTATTHDLVDGYGAVYNIYLNASNAIIILKGTPTLAGTDAVCPSTPAGGLKLGEVKVVCSGAIFNATTDDLDAATLTVTYANKTDVPLVWSDYSDKHWLYKDNLEGLLHSMINIVANSGVKRLMSNPNLVIGTSSKAKVKHDTFYVVTDGVIATIAGGEVAFTATTDDVTDGHFKNYNIYLDGTTVKILGSAEDAVCPATPAGKLKLGEVKVESAGALFDATTTNLDAATVTDTYTNKTDVIATADFTFSGYGQEDYLYSGSFKALLDDMEEYLNRTNNDKLLGNPTLVIGTSSKAKIKHSTFTVMRDGVISSITGGEVAFTATTHDIASGYGAIYNVYLSAANAVTILKGTATLLGTGAVCPATPAGGFKIGEVKIVTTALFDATTTLLDALTVTDTYSNKTNAFESIA